MVKTTEQRPNVKTEALLICREPLLLLKQDGEAYAIPVAQKSIRGAVGTEITNHLKWKMKKSKMT